MEDTTVPIASAELPDDPDEIVSCFRKALMPLLEPREIDAFVSSLDGDPLGLVDRMLRLWAIAIRSEDPDIDLDTMEDVALEVLDRRLALLDALGASHLRQALEDLKNPPLSEWDRTVLDELRHWDNGGDKFTGTYLLPMTLIRADLDRRELRRSL
jgi:hypothetical protein